MSEEFAKSNSSSMSEDVGQFMMAKIASKKEFKRTGLGAVNQHQKYKYAKLDQIYEAVEDALNNNNIDISHFREFFNGILVLVTRLTHGPSRQWIQDMAPIESEKPGNQAHGAALTYMKKYAVLNLCAIAPEEDDDGTEEQRYIDSPKITITQQEEITKLIKEHPDSMEIWKSIAGRNRITQLCDLKASEYNGVKYFITNYKKSVQK